MLELDDGGDDGAYVRVYVGGGRVSDAFPLGVWRGQPRRSTARGLTLTLTLTLTAWLGLTGIALCDGNERTRGVKYQH